MEEIDQKISRGPYRPARAIMAAGMTPRPVRWTSIVRTEPHSWVRTAGVFLVAVTMLIAGFTTLSFSREGALDDPAWHPTIEAGGVGEIRVGVVDSMVSTLNPHLFTEEIDFMTIWPCYSTLLMYDVDANLIGDLADSWEVNASGTGWHVTLASNAYFISRIDPTDLSHPVTANDVIFSYWTAQNNSGSALFRYLDVNGSPLIASMWAPTDDELYINTSTPYAPIMRAFAMIPIIPEYVWSSVNPMTYQNLPPVGSGPFYYALTTSPLAYVELRRNPIWHQETNRGWTINVDKLVYLYYGDAGNAWQDLNKTDPQIDIVLDVPKANFLNDTSGNPNVTGWGHDSGFVYEFGLNQMADETRIALDGQYSSGTSNQLLLDPVVKLAMAMAVDKQTFVDDVLDGLGEVATSLISDSSHWHYEEPSPVTFDPLAARDLLVANGWAYDKDGNPATPTTVPLYKKGDLNGTVYHPLSFRMYSLLPDLEWLHGVNLITQDMATAGILLRGDEETEPPRFMHILQLATLWYYADFDCYLWSYDFSPIVDPSTEMMDVMTTMSIDDGMSGLYWSNESFDQVYNASLGALDLSTRQDLVDQLQGLAYDDMGSQPVAYRERLFAANEAYWTNYGNWTEQFMLIPTYGAPWLYMQVRPPDTNPPSANAGEDLFVMGGVNVTLDGTGSTDDFGIVNYVWNFTYDGTEVVLTGMVTSFAFWIEGVYNITLNVTDAAGNHDTDTVLVTVSGMIPELGIPSLIVLGLAAVIVLFVRLRRRTRPD